MTTAPVIFISAVSKELKSARQIVANQLTALGYTPKWQDIFGTEAGDLTEMLRQQVEDSSGVIQLVGESYGFEPKQPGLEFGRVSYTQYEALVARDRGKPVWYLVVDGPLIADPHEAEPAEQRQLQAAYRRRVQADNHLWHTVTSSDNLQLSVLKLRDDLAQMRRRARMWLTAVVALLVAVIGGILWLKLGQRQQDRTLGQVVQQGTQLTSQVTGLGLQSEQLLQAIRELPAVLSQTARAGEREDIQSRLTNAYALLEQKFSLPTNSLARELPAFAAQLLAGTNQSPRDRGVALFTQGKLAEAEATAASITNQPAQPGTPSVSARISALELAGWSAETQIQYVRALEHFRAAAALTSQERDPLEWARVQHNLAYVLAALGQAREVAGILREVLQVRERVLGPEHPDTLASRNNLAAALFAQGKPAEAEREYRTVLAIQERVLGVEHPDTLMSRNNLAVALSAQGKPAEAEREYRAVLALRERVLGPEHPNTLLSCANLALALQAQGKGEEAKSFAQRAYEVGRRVFGEQHPYIPSFKELLDQLSAVK